MRNFVLGAATVIGMAGNSSTAEASGLRSCHRGARCSGSVVCGPTAPMCDVVQTAGPIVRWVPKTVTRTVTVWVRQPDGSMRPVQQQVAETIMVPQTALDVQL